ncbi:MAG: VOC family protein [Gemmatimonadaceae bacterium]|nr:VOC family protein [Gemmatimonadaceae bacterium]
MPTTGRIAQVALPVKDLARATAFYRDVVQLPLLYEAPNIALFDCAGTRLMLGIGEGERDQGASIIYYAVDDVRTDHQTVLARGAVEVRAPHLIATFGGREIWMAFYADSEGNTFALTSEHATTAGTAA